jgi:23S rRNA pseudouridine1911/1915/1917 synthase
MPDTLLDVLARRYPTAKRETLRRMVAAGRVTVNGAKPRTLKLPVSPDDRVDVSDRAPAAPAAARAAGRGPRLPFEVVHEDADLLVVNKPAGLLTSTVPGERRPTLLAAVRAYVADRDPRARVGLIHRLDRDAAGLLVFSKSDLAYQSLKTQFFHHTVERVYLAVTVGVPHPPAGRIESRLEERADGTVYTTRAHAKGQRAVTHYEVIERGGGGGGARAHALVRVRLETGRKHQIRVHLAERGTPILNDPVYGRDTAGTPAPQTPGMRLLAARLAVVHPRTGEPASWQVEPPPGFWCAAGADQP